jgi:transcriptional regulator with PAS, ATPase and Fis domain
MNPASNDENTINPATIEQTDQLPLISGNQISLFEAMPEIVLLISTNRTIEHMNQAAIEFFGDLRQGESRAEGKDAPAIRARLLEMVDTFLEKNSSNSEITIFDGLHLRYYVTLFSTKKGELVYWLIIEKISARGTTPKIKAKKETAHVQSALEYKAGQVKDEYVFGKKLFHQIQSLKKHKHRNKVDGKMVGSSKAIHTIQEMALKVAKTDVTILITGESGTGKELTADLIQKASDRKNKPFLKINCSTISDSLLESELFGYEKGSFTGANAQKKGKFEIVDGGTLFLDEIGEISPRMQTALLRVLQNGEIVRVGGNEAKKVDVRVITATNLDLLAAVRKEKFRLDLYYRLNIMKLDMPPLRARKEDIFDLAHHFTKIYSKQFGKNIIGFSEAALNKLLSHNWPGNIRELENIVQRSVLISQNPLINDTDLLFDSPIEQVTEQPLSISTLVRQFNGSPLKDIVAKIEKEAITQKLKFCSGNVLDTAKCLKISKAALYEKMKKYEISAKEMR